MGSTCYPHATFSSKLLSTSSPALSRMRIVYPPLELRNSHSKSLPQRAYTSSIIHSYRPSPRIPFSRVRTPLPVAPCGALDSRSGEDDPRAVETVLKLYMAMKNKNFNEISEIIGEECLCICNFVSTFQPFRGKEQVLAFFSFLIKNLGNNIEFVVQPTFLDGMAVGVSWKLEWKRTRVPLGKGFSIYMCHVYQGKVLIKNIEMFLEPLLQIEPLRLLRILNVLLSLQTATSENRSLFLQKTMASLTSALDGMTSQGAKLALKILFTLLLVAALLLFCRYPV